MSSLIGFEIKKFCNRRKNLLVLLIFIILSIVFITLNSKLEKDLKNSEITSMDLEMESIKNSLTHVENEIIRLPDNEKLKQMKTSSEEDLKLLKGMKIAYSSNDMNKYLEYKIQKDSKLVDDIESGFVISELNTEEMKRNIEINTVLLNEGIDPIFTQVSMEGFNFLRLFINSPISIIIVILIIVLSADVVSSEYDSNTYKLLFTQPISKRKILLSKIISSLIMVVIIVFGIIAIVFCVLGIKNGFGSINYPTLFYDNGAIGIVPLGKFLGYGLILFIILTTFICILAVTISSFCKSNSNSLSTSIIIAVALYMISNKGFFSGLAHLNPFVYFDISNVLQGSIATTYENVNINFKYGALTLGVSTIMLLAAAILLFEKKFLIFNKFKGLSNDK